MIKRCDAEDFRLSWTHVQHLLSVSGRADRARVLEKCLEHKWPSKRLLAEIKSRQGKKSKGGRSLGKRANRDNTLFQLTEETASWNRRYAKVWCSNRGILSEGGPSKTAVRQQRKRVLAAIKELEDMAVNARDAARLLSKGLERAGIDGVASTE